MSAARAALLFLLVTPAAFASDLLIRGGRLFDGTGAPPVESASILVRGGRIHTIFDGPLPATPGVRVLDAAGATVLPGLIDAHAHFSAAPGSGFRGDTIDDVHALNLRQLRGYLACGVTTVFDPGVRPGPMRWIQGALAAGAPGPRYLATGPTLVTPGGYPGDDWGTVETPEEVEDRLDYLVALDAVGVKIAIEQGGWPFRLPIYPPEIRRAIADGAARRDLPLYVHATSARDQAIALDLGVRAILHPVMGGEWMGQIFGSEDLSAEQAARMAASGTFQVSALSVIDTWPGLYDVARLDRPLVALAVPPVVLATARDPAAAAFQLEQTLAWQAAWLPSFLRAPVARRLWTAERLRDGLRFSQRNLRRLHEAGVPIVIGTDAPSPWPQAAYHFHGPQTLREIELVVEAGLTPAEALVAATRHGAGMLRISDETGTVEVGKVADLVVVEGDPLADPIALRRVRWTVRAGEARTPQGWMED